MSDIFDSMFNVTSLFVLRHLYVDHIITETIDESSSHVTVCRGDIITLKTNTRVQEFAEPNIMNIIQTTVFINLVTRVYTSTLSSVRLLREYITKKNMKATQKR